jgi:hypothetical protein
VAAPLGISIIVHGASKSGKSRLASTSPAPRLILDAESGSRFISGRIVAWDPRTQAPPQAGEWDTCHVPVHDYDTIRAALHWLQSGQHPFASVVLDSISEIQQRAIDSIAGVDQMKREQWGELLRTVSETVRKFRDLVTHPTRPMWAVVYIAMTVQRDGKWRPLMQGALKDFLPYYADICGYLFVNPPIDAAGTWPGNGLLVQPHPEYETGERVGGIFGQVVANPDIQAMVAKIYQTYSGQR